MHYAVEMCGNEYSLNGTIARDVRTRKFRHLHLRHFVRLPHYHHSLVNSRTFQDLALKFLGLSRTKPIFQDFPGPGNCTQKFRTFQDFPGTWEPCEDDEMPCVIGKPWRRRGRRRSVGSSFHRQGAAYWKERLVIFKGSGRWTNKSDHRWRTCVVTRLNRNQVVEILRLDCCENLIC